VNSKIQNTNVQDVVYSSKLIVSKTQVHTNIVSCSMLCYKSKSHKHHTIENHDKKSAIDLITARNATDETKSVLHDSRLAKLLKEPTLRFHLKVIYELLNHPQLTNETSAEARREIANKKLVNLRRRGSEENKLVEDFCAHVLESVNR